MYIYIRLTWYCNICSCWVLLFVLVMDMLIICFAGFEIAAWYFLFFVLFLFYGEVGLTIIIIRSAETTYICMHVCVYYIYYILVVVDLVYLFFFLKKKNQKKNQNQVMRSM